MLARFSGHGECVVVRQRRAAAARSVALVFRASQRLTPPGKYGWEGTAIGDVQATPRGAAVAGTGKMMIAAGLRCVRCHDRAWKAETRASDITPRGLVCVLNASRRPREQG